MKDESPQPLATPNPAGPIPLMAGTGESGALGGPDYDGAAEGAEARRPFSLRLLLRFKWTILLTFVVLAPTGVLLVRSVFVPEYTATALLEIYSVVPRLVVETDETGPITQYERYVQTQADIMRSTPVLQRVLERKDVQQSAWYDEPPPAWQRWTDNVPQRIERLAETMTAAPRKRTELVEITATSMSPADAALLANAVLDEYLKFARERFSEKDRELYNALTDEQARLTADIRFLEQAVEDARRELLSPSPDELIAQRRVRLDQYEAELRRLELDIEVMRLELAELEAATSQPSEGAAAPVAARYASDPEWRRLYEQWQAAEQRVTEAAVQFGDEHPTMVRMRQAAAAAREQVAGREREVDEGAVAAWPGPTPSGAVAGARDPAALRHQLRLSEIRRDLLRRAVAELRENFGKEFDASERLRQKAEELQRSQERYQAVARRLEELGEKTKVPASIRTISRAVAPTAPKDIKRLKLSIAAVIGALVAGVSLAVLRLRLSPRVEEVSDVGRAVAAACLWELPLEPRSGRRLADDAADRSERVRMMRTALLGRLTRSCGNTVQVTSAGPGSGKSTLATQLARSLAYCGKRVLLVEADLYRPALAVQFGVAPTPGLVDLLAHPRVAGEGVLATETPGLSLVPAGRLEHAGHVELLANGDFTSLLAEWRRSFEFIVFDSPPVLVTADAAILARHVDGTIMVVRERHCRRDELVEAYAKLSLAGGKLLATAFIGSRSSRGYGYGQGYYRAHIESAAPAQSGE